MRADVLADGGAGHVGSGRFRFAHAGERERADGCEASHNQTRLTQEAAAIETARLIADRRCETAATCLAFCSLDQHGSASYLIFAHDLFRKPVSNFRDHALARKTVDLVVGLHVIGFLVAGLFLLRYKETDHVKAWL